MNITGGNEIYDYFSISGFEIVFNASLTLLLNTLWCLIFTYLHNLTLTKQCVLVALYKEFIIVLILTLTMCNGISIGIYAHGYPMNWIPATIITISTRIGFTVLLFVANIIQLLKYRISKEKMLDPPMPWGDDEQRGIIWIRVFCWGLSIILSITMYAYGIPTPFYYSSIGKVIDPSAPIIHSGINIFLFTTCAFFLVGEKYYHKNNDGQTFDPITTRRLKYLSLGFVLAVLFLTISPVFVNIPSTPKQFGVWIRGKMFTTTLIVHLVIAIGTISNADHIKSYILKLMTNTYDQAFFLNIYLVPLFLFILIHGFLYIVYRVLDI